MSDLVVDSIVFAQSPRARTRFINQRTKKKVKEFLVKRRGYKRPDFNRMILDLGRSLPDRQLRKMMKHCSKY